MEGEHIKPYRSFTDLDVWKAARLYKNNIFKLCRSFPDNEKYRLCDQLIRSSRSIGSNIAEGYGRFTYKDQLHFCIQARGSLFETVNHLIDAFDCGYLMELQMKEHKQQADELEKLLNGYISWVEENDKRRRLNLAQQTPF